MTKIEQKLRITFILLRGTRFHVLEVTCIEKSTEILWMS